MTTRPSRTRHLHPPSATPSDACTIWSAAAHLPSRVGGVCRTSWYGGDALVPECHDDKYLCHAAVLDHHHFLRHTTPVDCLCVHTNCFCAGAATQSASAQYRTLKARVPAAAGPGRGCSTHESSTQCRSCHAATPLLCKCLVHHSCSVATAQRVHGCQLPSSGRLRWTNECAPTQRPISARAATVMLVYLTHQGTPHSCSC